MNASRFLVWEAGDIGACQEVVATTHELAASEWARSIHLACASDSPSQLCVVRLNDVVRLDVSPQIVVMPGTGAAF